MNTPCCLAALAFLAVVPVAADTVYQTNAQGKQVVIQRDAIVVKDDPSFLVYKHFDLKERRVEKVTLSQGSLPYSVDASNAAGRQQIVEMWKRFGYKATVKDPSGKSTPLFDVYFDFYPPGGRGSLLESVPPRTSLPILMDGGSADEFEFSKLSSIQIEGSHLRVTLRNGQAVSGQFLMPTDRPAEVRLLGISERYDPASGDVFDFSAPLTRLAEIRFE
jgi:hypothetical protein